MKTITITITGSRNQKFVGKTGFVSGSKIKIGRTEYKVGFYMFQPRKSEGDFTLVESKLEDCQGFFMSRGDKDVTRIDNYTIN